MNEVQNLIRKVGKYLDMGQSIALIKDTQQDVDMIINAALEEKKYTHKIIKIDIQRMSSCKDIADSIMDQANNFLGLDETSVLIYTEESKDWHFRTALAYPEYVSKFINTKIIIIINELEYANSFDTDMKIQGVMRSIFQRQHNVIYVFTGTSKTLIQNVFQDSDAPFFRFVTEVE